MVAALSVDGSETLTGSGFNTGHGEESEKVYSGTPL